MPDRLDFRQRQLFHLVEVSRQAEGLGLADLDGEVPVACHFLQHDVLEQLVLSRGEPDSLGDAHLDVAGLCGCGHGDLLSTRQIFLSRLAEGEQLYIIQLGRASLTLGGNQVRHEMSPEAAPAAGRPEDAMCRDPSGSGTDDRAGATWAELEGGPYEHRRRI
jgi:hypothetical protein